MCVGPNSATTGLSTNGANYIQTTAASVAGMTLYVQPVQDLTIDANVSRTQYEF